MADAGVRGRSMLAIPRFVLLNFFFWTLAPIFSVVYVTLDAIVIIALHLVQRNQRNTLRRYRRSISHYGSGILMLGWPFVRVEFVDLAPDDKPPFVFVSNHRSASDAFIMAVLPFECIQVLNIWPSRIPILGVLAKLAGYLKVREMPFEEFLADGTKLLNEGCSIIAFPEGTRSGSAALGPFHGSAFRLAQQSGAKIAPLVVCGNESIPPRGSAWLHPGRIVVSKLPSVTPADYADLNPYQLKTLVRDRMWRHMAKNPS
jgi:1-acyl-sn-glycerol-3-phosphate acyltransferase